MTENIRLSTGLMMMTGLIFIGVGVYYLDEGAGRNVWISILLLGFSLIGLGVWSITSPLIPSLIGAIFFPILFLYLYILDHDLIMSQGIRMLWGLLFCSVYGAAFDAYRQFRGLPILQRIEESQDSRVEKNHMNHLPKRLLQIKAMRQIQRSMNRIDGSVIQVFILRLISIPIILFAAFLVLLGLVGLLLSFFTN